METSSDNWYGVRLLFVSLIDGERASDALYEERIVLVRAASPGEARSRASAYAVAEEHSYANEAGETVSWMLHEICEVHAVDDPAVEGPWEVMSRFLREGDDAVLGPVDEGTRGPRSGPSEDPAP